MSEPDDTAAWETIPVPTAARAKVKGPRHSWIDAGAHTHKCKVCGLYRLTERPARGSSSIYGNIPQVKYRFGADEWRDRRPPCIDPKTNPRQGSLFGREEKTDADPRANIKRPAPVIHEATFIEPTKPEPPRIAPKPTPRVFTLKMESLPEGVDVALEIVDDQYIFASEYRWSIFFHTEKGCRAPKLSTMNETCSIDQVDKIVAGLMRAVGSPIKGLWIVAKRQEPFYMRAWEGTGREWKFWERGAVGEVEE